MLLFASDPFVWLAVLAFAMVYWQKMLGRFEMETNLDRFGRVIIPKKVRDKLGLRPGAVLEVQQQGGDVLLKPVPEEPRLLEKDGVLVFRGKAAGDLAESVQSHRRARLKRVVQGDMT
jgi:AbrB family looped-hinge helix DNA binding protein